ncbi:unnamed protein product [Symbiodinium sp. KB8]|nr:unnamed protein product [Symbiodinium sp. KB8]
MSILAPRNVYRYIKYVIGEQGQVLNRLLVRDQVGHPRPATYKLPPPDKAYGVKYPSDAFGTRDAVTFWNAPHVRKPRTKPPGPDLSNRVFGVVQSRTDAPLKSVMAHAYGSAPAKEDIMPSGTQHTKRVAAKAPPAEISAGATLSSALRTAAARERIRAQQSQGPGWKMSKFGKNTTGKLSTHSKNPAASHAAYAEMKRRKAELEAARKKGGMRYVDKVRARHAREAAAAAAQSAPSVHSEEGKSEAYAGGVPDDVPAMDMSSLEHEG